MTLVFFLLGALYVALIVALLASGANGVTVAFIAGGLALFQLFGSDKLALRAMGAREVSPARSARSRPRGSCRCRSRRNSPASRR